MTPPEDKKRKLGRGLSALLGDGGEDYAARKLKWIRHDRVGGFRNRGHLSEDSPTAAAVRTGEHQRYPDSVIMFVIPVSKKQKHAVGSYQVTWTTSEKHEPA